LEAIHTMPVTATKCLLASTTPADLKRYALLFDRVYVPDLYEALEKQPDPAVKRDLRWCEENGLFESVFMPRGEHMLNGIVALYSYRRGRMQVEEFTAERKRSGGNRSGVNPLDYVPELPDLLSHLATVHLKMMANIESTPLVASLSWSDVLFGADAGRSLLISEPTRSARTAFYAEPLLRMAQSLYPLRPPTGQPDASAPRQSPAEINGLRANYADTLAVILKALPET
jgi:hypothetical protein